MKSIVLATFIGVISSLLKSTYAFNVDSNCNHVRNVEHKRNMFRHEYNSDGSQGSVQFLAHRAAELKKDPSGDCVSIFVGAGSNDTKKCFMEGMNHTRCNSPSDLVCLCDSKNISAIVKNCTEGHFNFSEKTPTPPLFDPLFDDYFRKLCGRPPAQPSQCNNVPNPAYPTITCRDPFDGYPLPEGVPECLKKAANDSACGGSNNASCLCDSKSFESGVKRCKNKYPGSKDSIDDFLMKLCSIPPTLPGCINKVLKETQRSVKDSGAEKVLGIKKEIMFLIFGITIPVAFVL
ncbi:hypothetical protein PORY_002411 [Pneumocystis oryctolagi]|uniref:Uncharacterized protein n=1 Tax=Pneumocystis oryctolagi TaxID=42067 RepID=A0ACB7CA29_9ASCO|nr:hypothetical protein PORY_002411 [Pneumocystis oryctolagi]